MSRRVGSVCIVLERAARTPLPQVLGICSVSVGGMLGGRTGDRGGCREQVGLLGSLLIPLE